MKAAINHPEENYLVAFILPENDLKKVSGGAGSGTNTMKYRKNIIRGLVWATLTFFEFESVPEDFEAYFKYMNEHEAAVLAMIFSSTASAWNPSEWILIATGSRNEYANLDMGSKRELLMEVYMKFK